MKSQILTFCLFLTIVWAAEPSRTDLKCYWTPGSITTSWIQFTNPCIKGIQALITSKFNNVINYLALANYYLQDSVNRPGFANQYILDAYDARSTAIQLIDYLTMRGQNTQGQLVKVPLNYIPPKTTWPSLIDANQYVLEFESATTNLYHSTIATCEQQAYDDYHVVNWLSRRFLGKQLDGLKIFADRVSSLQKMKPDHQNLGEILFDLQLYYSLPERNNDNY